MSDILQIQFYEFEYNKNGTLYTDKYKWPPVYSEEDNDIIVFPIHSYGYPMTIKRLEGIVPHIIKNTCINIKYKTVYDGNSAKFAFIAFIDLPTLYQHFETQNYLWYRNDLFMILQKYTKKYLKQRLSPEILLRPVKYDIPSKFRSLPSIFLSKDIELKEYQRENISWMLSLEKKVDSTETLVDISNLLVPLNNQILFDPMNNEIKHVPNGAHNFVNKKRKRERETAQFFGGGLLDEVGLGKTLCSLILSAMNPCTTLLTNGNENKESTLLAEMETMQLSDENRKKLLSNYKTCHAIVPKTKKICSVKTKNGSKYCGRHLKSWLKKDKEYSKEKTNPLQKSIISQKTEFLNEIESASDDMIELRRESKINPEFMLLNSKATLIICPNQISQQWEDEVKKYMKLHGYKILSITTKISAEKYTVKDIMTADFVIITHNYLVNPQFYKSAYTISGKKTKSNDITEVQKTHVDLTNSSVHKMMYKDVYDLSLRHWFNEVLQKKNSLDYISPPLHIFYWHRIIVDEINEIAERERSDNIWSGILEKFSSRYRWCMSGTPFTRETDSLQYLVNYLTDQPNYITKNFWMYAPHVSTLIKNSIFRRNTKESVQRDYMKVTVKEEIKWLSFTDIEKKMYKSFCDKNGTVVTKDSRYLKELCCSPFLSDETENILQGCLTLDEAEVRMGSYYKKEIKKLKSHISSCHVKQQTLEKEIITIEKIAEERISNMNSPEMIENLKEQIHEQCKVMRKEIGLIKTSIKRSGTKLENVERASTYFNRVLKTITKEEDKMEGKGNENGNENLDIPDECPVCLIELEEEVGLTTCGHVYCWDCLVNIQKNQRRCCFCKEDLNPGNIHKVNRVNKETNEEEEEIPEHPEEIELKENIQKHGTKIAHILKFIKECDEQIILFSQWNKLLMSVESKLKESDISVASCRGNVHQKTSSIREFSKENSNVKVISLSSESAPSGINLTAASVIIFIEPVYSDSMEKINEIEEQAIGRAQRLGQTKPVRVIRFLVKNTVEEEIYNDRIRYQQQTV